MHQPNGMGRSVSCRPLGNRGRKGWWTISWEGCRTGEGGVIGLSGTEGGEIGRCEEARMTQVILRGYKH
jgi:hypothetical protein